jgi:DNA-directed RNA polymerase subunit RPC12/RpoP
MKKCRSCGEHVVRVAQYSPYRCHDVTYRYRCVGCGEIAEEKARPVKLAGAARR